MSGKEEKVEEIKASEVISELRQMRTGIDSFLLKFERFLKLDSPPPKIVVNKNEGKLYLGHIHQKKDL